LISSGQTKQTINMGSGVLNLCLKVLTNGLRLAVGLGSLAIIKLEYISKQAFRNNGHFN
jgi:hypothetical protein